MTAGLVALGDDRVDAAILKPPRFVHARCVADDDCAGRPHAVHKLGDGQAEVEADDLGADLLHHGTHLLVER